MIHIPADGPDGKYYNKTIAITTEIGREFLALNDSNRPLSIVRVALWKKVMVLGKWNPRNGDTIAFDWNGRLFDGQHRLAAGVEAGMTFTYIVVFGCDPSAPKDRGKSRDSADVFFKMYQEAFGERPKNHSYVSSIAYAMLRGVSGKTLTIDDGAAAACLHYDIISTVHGLLRPHAMAYSTQMAAAFCSAVLYFGESVILPLIDRFRTESWTHNDPLKALNTRLIAVRMKEAAGRKISNKDKLDNVEKYSITVAAIRAAVAGETRSHLAGTTQDFGEAEIDKRIKSRWDAA